MKLKYFLALQFFANDLYDIAFVSKIFKLFEYGLSLAMYNIVFVYGTSSLDR